MKNKLKEVKIAPYITVTNTCEEIKVVKRGLFRDKTKKEKIVQVLNIFVSEISHWLDYAVVLHNGKCIYCDHTRNEITEFIRRPNR